MKEDEARRKAQLQTIATKTAEKNARAAQKQAVVDMTPDEGVTPRLLSARVPGACHGWRPTRGPLVDTDMME